MRWNLPRTIAGGIGVAGAVAVAVAALGAPGDLTRVSLAADGSQGTQDAVGAAVSADGRFVAFASASALTGTPTGGKVQLYVRDRSAGTTRLASAALSGAAANDDVASDGGDGNPRFAVSATGRYVVFTSTATNLTATDTNGAKPDVFRKDMETGQVVIVSLSQAGRQDPNGVGTLAAGGDPDVSADGGRVAFTTGPVASTLISPDANGAASDVVVRDITAGTTTLASVGAQGAQAGDVTERPSISADGRVVAFEAVPTATNLVPGDLNAKSDVIVRTLAPGSTAAASRVQAGAGGGGFPDVSGDGRYVAFETTDALDAANDANAQKDVYRRDMATGASALASAADQSDSAGAGAASFASVSADGTRVAFVSSDSTLVGGDANAQDDVFERTIPARRTVRQSLKADLSSPENPATGPAIAANGGLVAFLYSDGTPNAGRPLLGGDANARADVFARERTPTDLTPPAITLSSPAEGAPTADSQVTISGTAGPDPSGVVSATLNGAPLVLGAGGAFTASPTLPLGATTLTVQATDGSGNTSSVTRTVSRQAPAALPAPPPTARVTRLRLTRAARRVTVRFLLSAPARVRVQLVRRVVLTQPRRRVAFRGVGTVLTRRMAAGARGVALRTPLLTPGRYQVRVTAASGGGLSTVAAAIVVRPPAP